MWNRIQYKDWRGFLETQRKEVGRLMLDSPMHRDKLHPIYNFILGYYHFQPQILSQYSPGCGVMIDLDGSMDVLSDLPQKGRVMYSDSCIIFDPQVCSFTPDKVSAFRRTLDILKQVQKRTPIFHCHGLHEWAMLYSQTKPFRTQNLPLRVSHETIQEVIKNQPMNCTHFEGMFLS